jgi:hypothetical protein
MLVDKSTRRETGEGTINLNQKMAGFTRHLLIKLALIIFLFSP